MSLKITEPSPPILKLRRDCCSFVYSWHTSRRRTVVSADIKFIAIQNVLLLPASSCVSFLTSQTVSRSGRQQSDRHYPMLQLRIHTLQFNVLPLILGF
jgi:hypothetical protein